MAMIISGRSRFRAAASPMYAANFVSGFSRIVHVLKTTTSASLCGVALRLSLAEPELLEHSFDALAVVRIHLAAEGGHVIRSGKMVLSHGCADGTGEEAARLSPTTLTGP